MMLVIISLLVFIAVAVVFLSAFSYRTRTTLALGGVFVVALGIMAGWGWGMIFGMPFTPLQRECPLCHEPHLGGVIQTPHRVWCLKHQPQTQSSHTAVASQSITN